MPPTSLLRWYLAVLALVALAIGRSWYGTRLDALTVDEAWHTVAGVEYVRTNDFRLNPEHPPLVKLVAGLAMADDFTLRPKAVLSGKGAERDFVEETFFLDNDFRTAHRRAHVAIWLLNGALLALLGILLGHTLGWPWALGTLAFLGLEPTVAAHAPVVMTDLPVALTLAIATVCAGRLVSGWERRWVIALGLAMGLALASKHSALPGLAGIGLCCTAAAIWQATRGEAPTFRTLVVRAGQLAVVVLLAVGMLWATYGFHFHAGADGSDLFNRDMATKIADLRVERWRDLIALLDRWQLLPRSYLWGLADTVRAGVEGRGDNRHLLWGAMVNGAPPWYTWPSFVLVKVPLALLALSAAGLVSWRRAATTPAARAVLLLLLALAATHLLALSGSLGTYAGVRHALPVIVVLAALSGAVTALGWQHRQRPARIAAAAGLALAGVMTLPEPRVWEYHNELVGGTMGAWRSFGNEGVDLGQRAYELAAFHDSVIAPTGAPVYSNYWIGDAQAKALGIRQARRADSLTDTNVAGIYEGYFVYPRWDQRPDTLFQWDPSVVFNGLTKVAEIGVVDIFRGRQVVPRSRANALWFRLREYIYNQPNPDDALVVRKAQEIRAVLTENIPVMIEEGNALIRLGRRDEAVAAFTRAYALRSKGTMNPLVMESIQDRITRLQAGEPTDRIPTILNPTLE